jgi:predicted Zn-dependent protease
MGEPHLKMGELLLRTGQYPEAETELRQALKLSPGQDQTLFQLGQVLVRRGRAAEAEKYLKAYEELKRVGDAVETLKDQIAHVPSSPEPHLRLARLYRRYSNFLEAAQEYSAYLGLKPGDAAARQELQQCRTRIERPTASASPRP